MASKESIDVDEHEYQSEDGHANNVKYDFDEDYVQCNFESATDGDDEISVAAEPKDYTLVDLEQDIREALRSSQQQSRAMTSLVTLQSREQCVGSLGIPLLKRLVVLRCNGVGPTRQQVSMAGAGVHIRVHGVVVSRPIDRFLAYGAMDSQNGARAARAACSCVQIS